jgi:BirA family biotin operon repressor/biotin-[acetyl-CoA-carboxylase] ligase
MYPTYSFQTIDSTNTKAKELAESGAASGAAVVAGYQTGGRGRLGKDWHSVAGKGLYCSIVVRPELTLEDYPKITLVAGLAVALVLDRVTGRTSRLKWPNDIYFRGRKIGGILTESSALGSSGRKRYAVVGIGVNVNHVKADFPFGLQETATSLFVETGREFVVEEIFQAVRLDLLRQLELFSTDGFQPLLEQWRKKDFLLGKQMVCVNSAGQKIRGIGLGPDDQGQLHVRDADGRIHEVLSGDVRLATS